MVYEPPCTLTREMSAFCMEVAELVGSLSAGSGLSANPVLHRELRIKTIHSSLAIEQNTLSEQQVSAILDGKRVLGPANEILEVQNTDKAYALLEDLNPYSLEDLLRAHGVMMRGLTADAGTFRARDVGVFDGEELIHAGTPATYVPQVMRSLFDWLATTDLHPLVSSCIFHYEFEFIHPFSDGNGRTGRMWQTLLLSRWKKELIWLPVESLIRERQSEYYAALRACNAAGDSGAFVRFMIELIRDALVSFARPGVVSNEDRALVLFGRNPRLTIMQLAEGLGVSQRTAERLVARLQASGRLRREGRGRGSSWHVV